MDSSEIADSGHWFVVQTRPRQVRRAELNLRNQGYTTYLPVWRVERIYRSKRVASTEPLFPNYLFIRLDHRRDHWRPIRSTRGVSRLVSFGADPVPVADQVIEEIRERTNKVKGMSALSKGDSVEITKGPFHGLDAVFQSFDSDERAILFLRILEKQVATTLPLSHIKRR